jgi:hypothetical protein
MRALSWCTEARMCQNRALNCCTSVNFCLHRCIAFRNGANKNLTETRKNDGIAFAHGSSLAQKRFLCIRQFFYTVAFRSGVNK